MRLPLLTPSSPSSEQRPLYEEMRRGIASNFNGFIAEREDGALMGPWNPWLHEPVIGKAVWDRTMAMTARATLPDNVRQIAILVVGHALAQRTRSTLTSPLRSVMASPPSA